MELAHKSALRGARSIRAAITAAAGNKAPVSRDSAAAASIHHMPRRLTCRDLVRETCRERAQRNIDRRRVHRDRNRRNQQKEQSEGRMVAAVNHQLRRQYTPMPTKKAISSTYAPSMKRICPAAKIHAESGIKIRRERNKGESK